MGYFRAAFLDAVDDKTPLIGYLPGKLKWHFDELGIQALIRRVKKL